MRGMTYRNESLAASHPAEPILFDAIIEEIRGKRTIGLIPLVQRVIDGQPGTSVQKDAVFTNRRSKETLCRDERRRRETQAKGNGVVT